MYVKLVSNEFIYFCIFLFVLNIIPFLIKDYKRLYKKYKKGVK